MKPILADYVKKDGDKESARGSALKFSQDYIKTHP